MKIETRYDALVHLPRVSSLRWRLIFIRTFSPELASRRIAKSTPPAQGNIVASLTRRSLTPPHMGQSSSRYVNRSGGITKRDNEPDSSMFSLFTTALFCIVVGAGIAYLYYVGVLRKYNSAINLDWTPSSPNVELRKRDIEKGNGNECGSRQ